MPAALPLLRVALAQLNPTVGDLDGNAAKVADAVARARDEGAQLVLTPELSVTGYLPEDLLYKEHFLADARRTLEELAAEVTGVVALVGFPERAEDVFNSVAVLAEGEVRAVYRKMYLPNYGVFDEQRYFQAGTEGATVDLDGIPLGLTICEDMWEPGPPASDEALAGALVLANPSASPYRVGRGADREEMFAHRARDYAAVVLVCNLVGGQDEVVFDGHSLALDHTGAVIARAAQFEEDLVVVNVDPAAAAAARLRDPGHRPAARHSPPRVQRLGPVPLPPGPDPGAPVGGPLPEPLAPEAEVYAALVRGLRDYVEKNGFEHVVLGLSGGVDSALVACLAVDALGPERVTVAVMPSRYSSRETQDDARALADALGVERVELPIDGTMDAYDEVLAEAFAGREADLTEENVQARIRGNLLMALSNKFGWLVLTTGNKSEMSVGYSTLYGDLAGGFAVIKDVPKTLVYRLVRHRNAREPRPVVPETILDRAPSAELRPDQRDEDSLPPYDVLDPLLEAYVEEDLSPEEIVRRGASREDVERVVRLVDRAEYKRRQAPPGIKVTARAFGRDRRMPITNRYRTEPTTSTSARGA